MRLVKPRRIAGLLMAVGTVVGITAAAAPARAADPWVTFSIDTGPAVLCLEADPGSSFQFQVYAQPCDAANKQSQWWRELDQGGGVQKWQNSAVGWCLYTDTILDGSPLALWPCDANISNTRWSWLAGSWGFGRMQSRISGSTGRCLTAFELQALPGTPMELWDCATTQGALADAQALLMAGTP
jgi:Ricin-type beta-trefoil lectin domain